MIAVPDCEPARNVTLTLPSRVVASCGSIVPSEVVNDTRVPLCTEEPPVWITVAVISAVPFNGTTGVFVYRVIVAVLGATSGTLSHAGKRTAAETRSSTPAAPAAEWARTLGLRGSGIMV